MYNSPLDQYLSQLRPMPTPPMARSARSGLYVPEGLQGSGRQLVAVDLFAGAGGFGLGVHQAGFHVVAAVEWDVWASMTYLSNLAKPDVKVHYSPDDAWRIHRQLTGGRRGSFVPGSDPLETYRHKFGSGYIANEGIYAPGCEHFWLQDIRKVSASEILAAIDMEPGEVDLVFGGPPCQGFSRAGRQDVMDERNSFVFEFAQMVIDIQPRAWVMENVPGLLDMVTREGVPVIDAFSHMMSEGGMGTFDSVKDLLVSQQEDLAAGLRSENRHEPQQTLPDETVSKKNDTGLLF